MTTKRVLLLLGALVMGLVTACGGGSKAVQSSPSHTPAPHHSAAKTSGIPQNNGGDHDGDNSGGPSDGDGNI